MNKRSLFFVFGLTLVFYFVNQYFSSKDTDRAQARKIEATQATAQTPPVADPQQQTFKPAANADSKETYYVLENDFQQLVFSNIGGALAEINLPLKSKENPTGVVRSIGIDRTMESDFPQKDHFPMQPYQNLENQVQEGKVGGYYPLLRRQTPNPKYYALNVVSAADESTVVYTVKRYQKDLIEFEATQDNRRITKTFSLPSVSTNAPYCFDVTVKVEGDARGLSLTTGVPDVELISGNAAPALKDRVKKGKRFTVELLDLPKTSSSYSSMQPSWISNSNGFFGVILTPLSETNGFSTFIVPGNVLPTRFTLIDSEYDLYPAEKYPGYQMSFALPTTSKAASFRVFAGPYLSDILEVVDRNFTDPQTGLSPGYIGAQSFHGWFAFISEPFAKFLMLLMKFFYFITHSWGFSIILLTVALRIMLYPLNGWSIKSSAKMQQVSPLVAQIQERNKKEPKKAQAEIMNLYREKGINPITGCFPILIQMPFLIGMFDLLKSAFELRGASFIPGWIDNLTAPDVLFSWHYPVMFFGTDFHLLPILLGVVMWFQQRLSSPIPKNQKILTDQQKQQKMMGNIMTLVFAVMFYHFPSRLNLYWLSSMALGILQQWWMVKKLKKTTIEVLPPLKKK